MRFLLLAAVAGLAFLAVSVKAYDEGGPADADHVDLTDEEVEALFNTEGRLAKMLSDMFETEDDDDTEEAVEGRARDSDSALAEEEKSAVDSKDQVRYNSFVDTFFRRLNSYARSRFDPLTVGLTRSAGGKPKSSNKKGKSKNSSKKGKKNKDKKKKGGKKKQGRHPKSLALDEEEEEEVEGIEEAEEHEITKREAEVIDVVEIEAEEEDEDEEDEDEDSLVRVTRDAVEEEAGEEVARRGKPSGAKRGGNKKSNRKAAKKGGKKGSKKGGKKSGKGKGKGKGKKSKKGKRSTKNAGPKTSRATVTGVATLRRDGDVTFKNDKKGKLMNAKFKLGPVTLAMNRKFGSGKRSETKEARAFSPELTGKLSIHVGQSGKARMVNFRVNKPSIVQVQGSLHKSEKGGKADNNFMENSISRFSPIASKKLKIASREILSAGEPKAAAA